MSFCKSSKYSAGHSNGSQSAASLANINISGHFLTWITAVPVPKRVFPTGSQTQTGLQVPVCGCVSVPLLQWEMCSRVTLPAEPQPPDLAVAASSSGGFGGVKQVVEAAGPGFGSGAAALTSIHQSEDTFRCKAAGRDFMITGIPGCEIAGIS